MKLQTLSFATMLLVAIILTSCSKENNVKPTSNKVTQTQIQFEKTINSNTGVFQKISAETKIALIKSLVIGNDGKLHGFDNNGNLYSELSTEELVAFFTAIVGNSVDIVDQDGNVIHSSNKTEIGGTVQVKKRYVGGSACCALNWSATCIC